MNPPIVGITLVALGIAIVAGYMGLSPEAREAVVAKEPVAIGKVNVFVIGKPSKDVVKVLSSDEAGAMDISYRSNLDQNMINYDMLKTVQLVILQGDPYFDMSAREAVEEYAAKGGAFIVIEDAGSKHPQYTNVAGWAWPAGQGIPVPATLIGEWAGYSDIAKGVRLRVLRTNHKIVAGEAMLMPLENGSRVFKVLSRGRDIVSAETDEGFLPAVIEGREKRVIYFAYDPGLTPGLLLDSVVYLAG